MDKKISLSLVIQMFAVILLLFVLPISIAGYYLYSHITRDLTAMEKERVTQSNQAAQSILNTFGKNLLGLTKSNSNWEANRVAVSKRDTKWIKTNVDSSFGTLPNVDFIVTTDLTGQVISQAGNVNGFTGKLANPNIVKQLQNRNEFTGLIQTAKGLAVIAAAKVTDDAGHAAPTGILIFGRLLNNDTLSEIKSTLRDDIALLTSNGTFLETSHNISRNSLAAYLSSPHFSGTMNSFTTSMTGAVQHAKMTTAIKDFTNTPIGVLSIIQKEPTSTAVQNKLIEVNIMIAVIMIVILMFMTFIVYRKVIIPIRQLMSVSENVAKGNLTEEVGQHITHRKDELGKLGNAMNVMVSNFRSLTKQVAETIEHLAAASQELLASSAETTQANHHIVSEIQAVASGIKTQLHGSMESEQVMDEMAKGIDQITAKVSVVSADSLQSTREAEQGNQAVQQAVQQMGKIDVSFKESVVTVTQLTERTKEIGQMASLITTIAEQTNMLALNAAIEAARAGDHGKGFAIVAEEVRKLAEQTATSAKQVSDLIQVIHQESTSSVEAINKVNLEVQAGLEQMNVVGKTFDHILSAALHVAHETANVSAVTDQIAASTKKVSASVEEMANVAKNSAVNSENVVISSQEQLAAMKEITSFSESLTHKAEELKELISYFKF